ncbi:MAG: sigma-70 family RNA polymerase sigma factor [Deltaproteobacteria bacterium]|jgi:RNA polymerase sigma-70 factor (ECF subfamily)|nr:sigma-70 family RNA polymerase sigma factor [Deltaproteobacteria bacterium]
MLAPVADNNPEWIRGLRAGEPSAFDAVYDHYRARIYSFLLRMTGRPAVAEELAQETWLRLAKHARRLHQDSDIGAWLYTVARNLARSHRRWVLLDPLSFNDLRAAPAEDSPLFAAVANQTQAELEKAVAKLPLKYREVLLLVVVEGFEPAQVAEILDRKPAAIRQQLSRARARIEEHLERAPRTAKANAT